MEHETYPAMCGKPSTLRLLTAGYAGCTNPEDWTAQVTSPGYSRLYYILGGDPYIEYDGRRLFLTPGCSYLLPTGFSFTHCCITGMEQYYFHLCLPAASGYDLLRSCPGPLSAPFKEELPRTLSTLLPGMEPSHFLKLSGTLLLTVAELFTVNRFSPSEPALSPCVKGAVALIGQNPSIQLTPGRLAEQLFVSKSSLQKKFRAEIGKPLGQYIDDAVFFEAEQLLRHSGQSILEISAGLGFCDQFYFSRRFKEKYRLTPQSYRKIRII